MEPLCHAIGRQMDACRRSPSAACRRLQVVSDQIPKSSVDLPREKEASKSTSDSLAWRIGMTSESVERGSSPSVPNRSQDVLFRFAGHVSICI